MLKDASVLKGLHYACLLRITPLFYNKISKPLFRHFFFLSFLFLTILLHFIQVVWEELSQCPVSIGGYVSLTWLMRILHPGHCYWFEIRYMMKSSHESSQGDCWELSMSEVAYLRRCVNHSVMSNSVLPHGHTKLFCPWNSPGKNTGMGCHSLLQWIFPIHGSNMGLPHCRQVLYCLSK